jgi:hypothetical protein
MFLTDDLVQAAEDLRKHAVEATYAILYGPRGGLEGLEVGEDFFPLWELSLPENREALERYDFALVKARRGQDWSLEPPRCARAGV